MKIDIEPRDVIGKIDITYLKGNITNKIIKKYLALCEKYNFYGLCLPITKLFENKELFKNRSFEIITVIGFPFGYDFIDNKLTDIVYGKNLEIDEYDVVMNISKFLDNDYRIVLHELTKIRRLIKSKVMKVIIETCYLSEEQIIDAVKLLIDANVEYVKTSTGFGSYGAKLSDVALIKDKFGDTIKIKAAGGIKTYGQAVMFLKAGADRLGMSSVEDIIAQYERN
ncbi:deoxyribose-phosphate aldolase [Deferribacter abyssi]|uniref:deoxyribose-phosphate aldolase n=1 Tax=Deferribacter abyssi TaxID=213806 RepID=UPI003C181026